MAPCFAFGATYQEECTGLPFTIRRPGWCPCKHRLHLPCLRLQQQITLERRSTSIFILQQSSHVQPLQLLPKAGPPDEAVLVVILLFLVFSRLPLAGCGGESRSHKHKAADDAGIPACIGISVRSESGCDCLQQDSQLPRQAPKAQALSQCSQTSCTLGHDHDVSGLQSQHAQQASKGRSKATDDARLSECPHISVQCHTTVPPLLLCLASSTWSEGSAPFEELHGCKCPS